tara:strand:+ start:503 stop:3181 length:2679 start_codon:yes stop_codon:yes gene_type:complete
MTRSSELSPYKFQAPKQNARLVHRSALIERIAQRPVAQCIVAQAPAGHGKTTLLGQLYHHSKAAGIATSWLRIDEADNDFNRLLLHLNEMISQLEVGDAQQTDGSDHQYSVPHTWSDRLINRLQEIGAPVHLFFDDFQSIDEPDVELLFREVIRNCPDNTTIFIGSRAIPRIGICELQVQQRIEILRYDELKFSLAETQAFFAHQETSPLSDDDLHIIYNRAEGWPAALQLFRLTLSSHPLAHSLNNLESYTPFQITEYLSNNVLQRQAPEIQDFLLKSALLPKLNASLCEAVTGRSDAQEVLLEIEQQGLFLNNIDHERRWFQFHGLFAQYLKEHLQRRSPGLYKRIHRQAAQWFFNQELYEDAMDHAIAATDFDLATCAMDLWATEQITQACLHSVERWAAKIPVDAIFQRPSLVVKITWALTFLRRRTKVLPYLKALKEAKAESSDPHFEVERQITMAVVEMSLDNLNEAFSNLDNIDTEDHQAADFWAFELGAASNIQAFERIARGNFAGARYHIAVGRNHNQGNRAPFLAGYNTGLTITSAYLQGRVDEAYQRSLRALQTKNANINDSYAAVATVCCALYPLYERGDCDSAIKVFEQYHSEINTGLLLDFVACAYLPMIRIYDAQNEISKANALLETLEDIGIGANWPRLRQLCAWENIRRAIISGELSLAQQLADQLPEALLCLPFEHRFYPFAGIIEDVEIGQLRLQIHCQEAPETESILRSAIQQAQANNFVPREIKLRLLSALLAHRKQKSTQAGRELKTALTLAADYGFKRTVIDEGPAIKELLKSELSARWPANLTRHVNDILGLVTDTDHLSQSRILESLTARELQMLTLLAKGETNKGIARHLFVSENTVKFHLKNIFQKMGVHTRTQAISTAISFNIV